MSTTTNTQAKLLRQFGQALLDRVFAAGNGNIYSPDENNAVMYRNTLDCCLAEQLAAAPASPAKAKSPGKRELKKQQLRKELLSLVGHGLDGVAGVPFADATVTDLRKAIAQQVRKQLKAAKARQAKKAANAVKTPSKTELKKQKLNAELVALGGKALPKANVTELRKAIAQAKKAAKAAKAAASGAPAKKTPKAKKAPKAYDADKAFAKIAAKAAKVQKKVDGIVEEIFSYAVLNKLSQGDHISLCQRVKEVDEHCSSSLIDGVTMKEMKTIRKEQKALHRKLTKAAKKD